MLALVSSMCRLNSVEWWKRLKIKGGWQGGKPSIKVSEIRIFHVKYCIKFRLCNFFVKFFFSSET